MLLNIILLCWCRNFENLIPDAPELIHSYLEGEADASCKRNAFMMLIHVDRVNHPLGGGVIDVICGDKHFFLLPRSVHWSI